MTAALGATKTPWPRWGFLSAKFMSGRLRFTAEEDDGQVSVSGVIYTRRDDCMCYVLHIHLWLGALNNKDRVALTLFSK